MSACNSYKLVESSLKHALYMMLTGREFHTEAPKNVNEWRNSSSLGLGVYPWYVEEDQSSLVWISDVKVKDVVR